MIDGCDEDTTVVKMTASKHRWSDLDMRVCLNCGHYGQAETWTHLRRFAYKHGWIDDPVSYMESEGFTNVSLQSPISGHRHGYIVKSLF